MKTLKYSYPMLLMIGTLLVVEGCYTSFAVPNQGMYETYADDSEVAVFDSVAGPGLVYHEDRYADDNCNPGIRIIVYERPSLIVYNDPWDDWYWGFGWHNWYGWYGYSGYYDPWRTSCIFTPWPVVYHSYYWNHPWYSYYWRHHWAYDPWPVYHHAPSYHQYPIHARVQPERRTFDRRDRTVAARTNGRSSANKTVVRSTPAKNTPLAKGNSRTESRTANRRMPVTIRDIRHTEPATQSKTSGSVQKGNGRQESRNVNRQAPVTIRDIRHTEPAARSTISSSVQKSVKPQSNTVNTSRSESRREPVIIQKKFSGGKSAQTQKAVRQTTTQPQRSVTRTRPSEPVRVQTKSRSEPVKSARSSASKPSVKSVRPSGNSNASRRSSGSASRRVSVSRSSGSRPQSSPKSQSGSSRSSNSGSSRRSRR